MKSRKGKPDTKRKSNKVGNSQNRETRRAASNTLPKAKALESKKDAEGYVWITLGKTSKQVRPGKIQLYLDEGWRLTKK